jgi:hypothetical protein
MQTGLQPDCCNKFSVVLELYSALLLSANCKLASRLLLAIKAIHPLLPHMMLCSWGGGSTAFQSTQTVHDHHY